MAVHKRHGSPYFLYDFTWKGERFRGTTEQTKKYLAEILEDNLRQKVASGE